ncbi:hypothetical protein D9M69_702090 [compost metagenome]
MKIPYCGWAVMPISSADAWELYTLRANLEMLAASLASQNMDSGNSTELLRAFEELANACRKQDRTQVAEADFKLHKTIVTQAPAAAISHCSAADPGLYRVQ